MPRFWLLNDAIVVADLLSVMLVFTETENNFTRKVSPGRRLAPSMGPCRHGHSLRRAQDMGAARVYGCMNPPAVKTRPQLRRLGGQRMGSKGELQSCVAGRTAEGQVSGIGFYM